MFYTKVHVEFLENVLHYDRDWLIKEDGESLPDKEVKTRLRPREERSVWWNLISGR